ncbi:hypothetical protein [uncultured Eudoraea sp.]|uniref:hypothetical protein n=1 Tax=uncultured Eudoraea sp. TaxID=1035614 RepID=UPI00262DC9EE|nr:hypothetical protein [uncultured Eudoraea sp.]
MKNIFYCLFLVFAFSYGLQAQLNDYKYIIVPKSFEGFKYPNQYKTSTLIKHLFTKKGFQTYYEDDRDPELNSNRCLGLLVRLNHKSGMFITKATISLEDCNSKKIFTSLQGSSKEKDFALSYKEAIEMAFTSIDALDYSYNPVPGKSVTANATNPGADEKSTLVPDTATQTPIPSQENTGQAVVAENATTMTVEPKAVEAEAMSTITETSEKHVLYAQQISNGYQLVDSSPKIRLKIYKTSNPEVYIGINEQGNGIVYKRGSQWYFEYYEADKLQIEELTIKF